MSQRYFKNCQSPQEAKKLFKELSKKLHPDKEGGSEEAFKEMLNQYEQFQRGEDPGKQINYQGIYNDVIDGLNSQEAEQIAKIFQDKYPNTKFTNTVNAIIGLAKLFK